MARKIKIISFLLGIVLLTIGNWPSIVKIYFPANLPFCVIGGILFGWFGMKLLLKN